MKTHTPILALLGMTLLFGCGEPDADDGGNGTEVADSSGGDSSGGPTTTATATTTATTASTTATTTATTTTSPTTTSTTTEETSESSESADTTDTDEEGFDFPDDPYDAYTQIDRHGAVEAGTAGILAPEGLGFGKGSDISLRDEYNASNPVEDAAGMWLGEIADSIVFFHGALDDDLVALGLVPATVDQTVAQAGPVILPDTIKYDPSLPTAYPNGRRLEDPVVDITLAAVLIELGPNQPLSLFADLPLNPPANDVPFEAEFPYLAAPHLP